MGDSDEQRPKRQKRDSSYKAKAFEKFKDIKSGKRNKYADEEIENVYDIVEESEYIKKVVDRQDDDWIVDDDGSGYVEDGRDVFDDDLDVESINAAASTSRGKKRKKKSLADGKAGGKGKLQYMLSNMPTKKKEETNLNNDDVLSELLEEIDETPNTNQIIKPKPITSGFSTILANRKAEKEYMRKLVKSNSISNERVDIVDKPKILKQVFDNNLESIAEKNDESLQESKDDKIEQEDTPTTITQDDCFDDDLDMTQIEEFNTAVDNDVDNKDQNDDDDDVVENWFSTDFQTANLDDNIETTPVINDDDDDNEPDTFRFYWLDAYEDSNKQPGVVFLFGKTWDDQNKNYSSCCVVVREIERKIYFLPKPFDADTGDEITSQDVYKEINETIMKPRQVKHFKARPIAKKYAFEAGIPIESDYIEVRYSARDPAVSSTTQGRTFSRVFGTESSYLEILLLERKIKGPCWLDITNFTKTINPISWCKIEIDCCKLNDINLTNCKVKTPPPLIVASINMRRSINPKTLKNEIVMLSCVINQKYFVDKPVPSVPFQKHFCVFTSPSQQIFPMNLHTVLNTFKGTTVQKVDTEKALLNYFIIQLSKIDCDLIVGHDLIGYQMNIISERLCNYQLYNNFSKLSRIRRTLLIQKKLERELFLGRLVCDIKQTTKELIKCRSYDLNALCETVLKLNENQRIDLELDDIPKMFQTSHDIIKLIQLTMQDTLYIMKIMYQLNMIPLAIQITNICGNVLSKTLLGGRSERNEYLLLHAFYEKNYIVPDKLYNNYNKKGGNEKVSSSRKKPTYSGGLVLEPKVGFYDKLVLLMDFNSLYPSIIQEYNICFTTIPIDLNEDNVVLPASNLPSGILPTEIRKLVESRREVKKLMNTPDLSNDLKQQYNIRQMALKLTANSMYGCLGFTNSRFYAKNLAALITLKGREILTNTRDVVEKMNYNVLYGDTDSLMILTNIIDYDGVFKIGNKIKQEINKLYKQIELDIDGVFKCLLLLKKKKYAAINLTKTPQNELKQTIEYKGLDIVRRDWSQLASEAGKFLLKQIFNDTITLDERINAILQYLKKLKEDAQQNTIPLSLLVITKQLTKNPELYNDKNTQPHVQVALRYNKDYGGHLRAGDTVPYIICDDGTNKPSTQRAYHIEELKNNPSLKIDINYYMSQQIYPVITRICEPIDGIDDGQIADALGLDITRKPQQQQQQQRNVIGENITRPEIKFRNVDKFSFKCVECQFVNTIDGQLENSHSVPFEKCSNTDCGARPFDYSANIQNQLIQTINSYIDKYYLYEMYCEDPMCTNETTRLPLNFLGRFPLCTLCKNGVLLKKYTEANLYSQLSYLQYIFDLSKLNKKPILEQQVERFYDTLKETVDKRLNYCAFSIINLDELFSGFKLSDKDYTFVPDNEDSDVDE